MDVRPADIFQRTTAPGHAALILLNQPLVSAAVLKAVWPLTTYRICADGGANRLHEAMTGMRESDVMAYVRWRRCWHRR